MSSKRKINISVILIIFLITIGICCAIIISPISFNSISMEKATSSIVYIKNTILNGEAFQYTTAYDLNEEETNKVIKILNKYSYHICIETLTHRNSIEDYGYIYILALDNNIIMITDVSKIIINDRVYRVGYFGRTKIEEMISELMGILSHY